MNHQLQIVQWPHPALTTASELIVKITDEVRDIATQMRRLMLEHRGFGLAANQVGKPIRMFVAKGPMGIVYTYLNPAILFCSTEPEVTAEEGCLSWPGHRVLVARTVTVRMAYMDLQGRRAVCAASDIYARCWQHEIDHLDGINLANPRTNNQKTEGGK